MSLENLSINDDALGASSNIQVISSQERKARKALEGLGLKKVEGITRVTVRRPRGVLMVVSNPEVFKSPHTDCYIVFGEPKLEDPASAAQALAQQQVAASQEAAQGALAQGGFSENNGPQSLEDLLKDDDEAPALESADKKTETKAKNDGPVDAGDVELVMQQANCDKEKAEQALRDADGDIIVAIMKAQGEA